MILSVTVIVLEPDEPVLNAFTPNNCGTAVSSLSVLTFCNDLHQLDVVLSALVVPLLQTLTCAQKIRSTQKPFLIWKRNTTSI